MSEKVQGQQRRAHVLGGPQHDLWIDDPQGLDEIFLPGDTELGVAEYRFQGTRTDDGERVFEFVPRPEA